WRRLLALLGVVPGLEHAVAATPRAGHLVGCAAQAGDHTPGAAARGARRAVLIAGSRAGAHPPPPSTRTASSTPSPTGVTVEKKAGSSSRRWLNARAPAICSSVQNELPRPSATVPDNSTLSTASREPWPSKGRII